MTTVTATTGSEPIVLDSSGWLEYLTNGSKAPVFAPYLEGNTEILVPSIVIYEVRKILQLKLSKTVADIFLSDVLRRSIVSFDDVIAVQSAEFSIQHGLAMADAIIYATARHFDVQLVTSDSHFANLSGVTLL
jgi:predicted nucleic acid-binding protein